MPLILAATFTAIAPLHCCYYTEDTPAVAMMKAIITRYGELRYATDTVAGLPAIVYDGVHKDYAASLRYAAWLVCI